MARALLLALLLAGCRAAPQPAPEEPRSCPAAPFARDWEQDPALVELDGFRGALYVVGDVHGALAELEESLARAGLAARRGAGWEWTGGAAVLVQAGDLVNKGPRSLEAIDLARALEEGARRAGGRAIFLAGNHEIGFLAKAPQRWYRTIHAEAQARGLELCRDVHAPDSPYGRWLRTRPAAVFVGGLAVTHSGNTQGKSRAEIAAFYRALVDRGDWGSKEGCGDAAAGRAGFFNADVWWGPEGALLGPFLERLGVRQALFGNDPDAFLARGELVGAFADASGRALVKLDVGTVYGHSRGAIYRCAAWRDDGGCAAPERLVNPASPQAPAAFEPLPVRGLPPPQPIPEVKPWGC